MAKEKGSKANRLADLVGGGGALEGTRTSLDQIKGIDVQLLAAKVGPSTFNVGKEYATMQIDNNGEIQIVMTGAQVIVDDMKQLLVKIEAGTAAFPLAVKFKKMQSKQGGRQYWAIE